MSKNTTTLFHNFYTNLSNNNQAKYDELRQFSKNVLNGTLDKPITQIIGSGSNGKSTLMRILHELSKPKTMIGSIDLIDKIISTLSETTRYIIMNESDNNDAKKLSGIIKQLNGEDTMYARPLFGEPISTYKKPNIKFIFLSNYLLNDEDPEFSRRSNIIIMDAVFTSANKSTDHNMANKLLTHKDLLKEFILNYKNDDIITSKNKSIDSLPQHKQIVIENTIDNTFKLLNIVDDAFTTLSEYIGKTYGIDAKHNVIKAHKSNATVDEILKDKDYIGVYLIKINDNLHELHVKKINKVNKGWFLNNFVDDVKTEKIGSFICL